MMKRFAIVVTFIVLIAAGLFFRTILNALYGMTVLEMMQQAVSWVLHVIVVSILGYGAYFFINELALPIVKTFQWKQRRQRRQIRGRRTPSPQRSAIPSRRRRDLGLLWLLSQMGRQYDAQTKQPKRQ